MDVAQVIADIRSPFSAAMFARKRLPIAAGQVDLAGVDLPSCLDMLVKLPLGKITLPEPYASDSTIREIFRMVVSAEDAILPGWDETRHVYLTVDRRYVDAGQTHRNAGWHFDGMQGSRYSQKLPVCHQYIVSSFNPTEFIAASVDASDLHEDRHNWFEIIGARAEEAGGEIFRPDAGDLMLMTAYQIHRSPPAEKPGWRTFIRVDISLKEQDRLGNTENPSLSAPWAFVERRLPEGLERMVSDSGWEGSEKFGSD